MNDEPSSSAAAAAPSPAVPTNHDPAISDTPLTAREIAERRKKNRQLFNRKRGELLDDLLRNLDILVYAELSTIYYMDCSFFRFLLRALVQFSFLSPRPSFFPEGPYSRPYLGAIVGSNLLCFLLHAINNPPSAGEATRGYLHGGLAMDFIGQKGPSSKWHLLLLDFLTIVLQIIQLSAHLTRLRLKETSRALASATSSGTNRSTGQDLDHEERGLLRSEVQQDIEMQTLNPDGAAQAAEESGENGDESREALLASTAPRTDAHIFDAFHAGQIVLADLDITKTIKEQLLRPAVTEENIEAQRLMRANLAGELFRMRFGGAQTARTAAST